MQVLTNIIAVGSFWRSSTRKLFCRFIRQKNQLIFLIKIFLLGFLEQFMTEIKHNAGVFLLFIYTGVFIFLTFVENFLEHLHRFDQILKSGMDHHCKSSAER